MHPADYPWPETAEAGVLRPDGLRTRSRLDVAGRVPVIAVGSNASPTVLRAKLGGLLETGMPLAIARVEGLAVGHSAHVSARGYIAAAPTLGGGAGARTVCWCDPAQLEALDATEPNYRRRRLPDDVRCTVDGAMLEGAEVYASRHGVIGEDASPLPLGSQAVALAWLRERLPRLATVLAHDRLLDARAREAVRVEIVARGLVVHAGL